jgi:hypothetical protein
MNPITALIRTYFVGRSRWVTDQLNCHWISGHQKRNGDCHNEIHSFTAVRLKVEENQLVGVFGEIGVVVDGLKGA